MDFRAGRLPDGSRDPSTFNEESFAPLIRDGDMVVFFEGREPIGFDRMKAKTIWQCRHGAFHHDEVIGKPFGSRVFSRTTKGYVYALSPTPELWSHVVPNRTQIVQDFDQSIVIFRLDLKPGDIVVESGTGSGVMSTAIMRTIAPSGFLYSFEFNRIRANRAQEEFEENALGGLAKVTHRDVCATRADGGGFDEELDGKADAVFLDLPEPWLAVEHAKLALKPGKKVCSYSPCIEQVMKTCEALRSAGFHSVTTIEFRVRNINYVEVQLDVPDFGSNPAAAAAAAAPQVAPAKPSPEVLSPTASAPTPDGSNGVAAAGAPATAEGTGAAEKSDHDHGAGAAVGGGAVVVADAKQVDGSGGKDEDGGKASEKEGLDGDGEGAIGDADKAADNATASGEGESPKENDTASAPAAVSGSIKRPREEASPGGRAPGEEGEDGDGGAFNAGRGRNERLHPKAAIRASEGVEGGARKPPMKLVCAQPFPMMRGHTAFLTFATTPVSRQLGVVVAVAAQGATALSTEETKGGSVGEQNAGLGGGDSGGGIDSSGGGSGGGGGEMDVCEEGDAGDAKGKGREVQKPADDTAGRAAAVSDVVGSSSVPER